MMKMLIDYTGDALGETSVVSQGSKYTLNNNY